MFRSCTLMLAVIGSSSLSWNEDAEPLMGRDELASAAIAVRYCMTFFVFSVFPAPDSPLLDTLEVNKVGDDNR